MKGDDLTRLQEPLLVEHGNMPHQGMIFVPQIRPLALKRPNLKPGLFTPRKCTAFVVIAIFVLLTILRLMWGMRYMYTEMHNISDSDGELVILPESFSQQRNAYCLDGSPPAYYFRKGSQNGVNNWLIELEPGAWCYNEQDCYNRSFTRVGSSVVAPNTSPFEALTSSNPKINPEFHDWNVARFLYCDGASFAGSLKDAINYKGRLLHLKGFFVLETLLDYLLETTSLKQAKHVLFSGYSAGGLGVILHADYVRSKLPSTVHFKAVSDAGFFLDHPNTKGSRTFQKQVSSAFQLHNIKDSPSLKECFSHEGTDTWKCFFAQYKYKYLKVPLYLVNSMVDRWAVRHILDVRCNRNHCIIPEKDKQFVDKYRQEFIKVTKSFASNHQNGVFLTNCLVHTMCFSGNHYWTTAVNGTSLNTALSDWFYGKNSVNNHVLVETDLRDKNCAL